MNCTPDGGLLRPSSLYPQHRATPETTSTPQVCNSLALTLANRTPDGGVVWPSRCPPSRAVRLSLHPCRLLPSPAPKASRVLPLAFHPSRRLLPSHGPPCVGAGVYYIAGPTVALPNIGAAALVAEHYASNTEVRGELGTALTNCERARRVLGWEAEYGWTTETQHPKPQKSQNPYLMGYEWI